MQKLKTMNAELVAGTFSTQSLGIRIARVAMAGIGAVIACGTIPGYVEPVTQTLADGTSVTTAGHWMEPPQIAFRWLGVAMAVLGAIVQRKNGGDSAVAWPGSGPRSSTRSGITGLES